MDSLLMVLAVETLSLACFACLQRRMVARLVATEHQLQVYKRQVKQPKLKDRDRLLWVLLSKIWKGWRKSLVIVQPETVLRWQKRRLRDWWRRRSQPGPGRPLIRREHIDLIRLISRDHPEYGEDYIANELEKKFGIKHSTATVRKYMVKSKGEGDRKRSQSWATFLRSQAAAIWTCDFFVAHTVGLRAIYVFVVMELSTRKVVHFNVTENPTLPWIKQQIRNACLDHDPPRLLVHDNDGKFGQFGEVRRVERDGKKISCRSAFARWLWEVMGIEGIPIPYGAPNAQAHIERLIGTIRRQCLDQLLVCNERHLCNVLTELFRWYHTARVHQGLGEIPDPDPELQAPVATSSKVVAIPILNGLHHDYRRAA